MSNSPSSKFNEILAYAKKNKEEFFVYLALAVGLITFLIIPKLGEVILGGIVGFYFSSEISYFIQNSRSYILGDRLRYIVFVALLLAFFLTAPALFVIAILVAAIKQFIFNNKNVK